MDFITLNNKRRITRKQQKKALKRAIRESRLRDVQLGTDVEKKAVDRIISAMGRAVKSGRTAIQVGLYYAPCETGTLCGGPVYGASEEYLKSKALIKLHLESMGYFVQSWRPDRPDNCDLDLDDWFEELDYRSGEVELYEYFIVNLYFQGK